MMKEYKNAKHNIRVSYDAAVFHLHFYAISSSVKVWFHPEYEHGRNSEVVSVSNNGDVIVNYDSVSDAASVFVLAGDVDVYYNTIVLIHPEYRAGINLGLNGNAELNTLELKNAKVWVGWKSSAHIVKATGTFVRATGKAYLSISGAKEVEACEDAIGHIRRTKKVTCRGYSRLSLEKVKTVDVHENSTTFLSECGNITVEGQSNIHVVAEADTTKIIASGFATIYAYDREPLDITEMNYFGNVHYPVQVVQEEMVVYKKLRDRRIAKLRLDVGQEFQHAQYSKCRTNKAFVLDIYDYVTGEKHEQGLSTHRKTFVYTVNTWVDTDNYDPNIRECSDGIHFFLTEREAMAY